MVCAALCGTSVSFYLRCDVAVIHGRKRDTTMSTDILHDTYTLANFGQNVGKDYVLFYVTVLSGKKVIVGAIPGLLLAKAGVGYLDSFWYKVRRVTAEVRPGGVVASELVTEICFNAGGEGDYGEFHARSRIRDGVFFAHRFLGLSRPSKKLKIGIYWVAAEACPEKQSILISTNWAVDLERTYPKTEEVDRVLLTQALREDVEEIHQTCFREVIPYHMTLAYKMGKVGKLIEDWNPLKEDIVIVNRAEKEQPELLTVGQWSDHSVRKAS